MLNLFYVFDGRHLGRGMVLICFAGNVQKCKDNHFPSGEGRGGDGSPMSKMVG